MIRQHYHDPLWKDLTGGFIVLFVIPCVLAVVGAAVTPTKAEVKAAQQTAEAGL